MSTLIALKFKEAIMKKESKKSEKKEDMKDMKQDAKSVKKMVKPSSMKKGK